jgi:hypothetical protein
MIAPSIALARMGYAKSSLVVALVSTSALVVDYLYNWDGITYPYWLLGAFTWLFPFTFLAGLGAIGVGLKAILDSL